MGDERDNELNRALTEFTKIQGIGLSKAKKLYEMGYRSIEDLKKASFEEIAKGIGASRATLIKEYIAQLAEKEKTKAKPEVVIKEKKVKKEAIVVMEGKESPKKEELSGYVPATATGVREGASPSLRSHGGWKGAKPHPAEGTGVREGRLSDNSLHHSHFHNDCSQYCIVFPTSIFVLNRLFTFFKY